MTLRQITKEEWDEREWLDATTTKDYADGRRVFLPGDKPLPVPEEPDDGFSYTLESLYGEENKWFPRMTDA